MDVAIGVGLLTAVALVPASMACSRPGQDSATISSMPADVSTSSQVDNGGPQPTVENSESGAESEAGPPSALQFDGPVAINGLHVMGPDRQRVGEVVAPLGGTITEVFDLLDSSVYLVVFETESLDQLLEVQQKVSAGERITADLIVESSTGPADP